ncbi:MAG TPA: transposase [Chloroflexota bacterium]|jgi:hypothetical protein
MRKSRFSETEIVYAIKQVEAGIPVGDVARKCRVSQKTIYWSWTRFRGHFILRADALEGSPRWD